MRFFKVAAAFAFCTGAIAQGTGNGTQVNADITAIATQLNSLSTSLNAFTGGTAAALAILAQTKKLQAAIDQAAADSAASPALSLGGTALVAAGVTGLQVNIFSTLSLLISKEPQFQKAILGFASADSIVKNTLSKLKNSTDTFGANIVPKFIPAIAQLAPVLVGNIDYHFVNAMDAFTFSM